MVDGDLGKREKTDQLSLCGEISTQGTPEGERGNNIEQELRSRVKCQCGLRETGQRKAGNPEHGRTSEGKRNRNLKPQIQLQGQATSPSAGGIGGNGPPEEPPEEPSYANPFATEEVTQEGEQKWEESRQRSLGQEELAENPPDTWQPG
jgi:hypothetical protein